jgi:hypothetical protein
MYITITKNRYFWLAFKITFSNGMLSTMKNYSIQVMAAILHSVQGIQHGRHQKMHFERKQ